MGRVQGVRSRFGQRDLGALFSLAVKFFVVIFTIYGSVVPMRVFVVIVALFLNACAHQPSPYDTLRARSDADAQKIIDACWAISQKFRDHTGMDSQSHGALITAECMENHFIELFLLIDKSRFSKDDEDLEQQFRSLKAIYLEIYNDIYNSAGVNNLSAVISLGTYAHLTADILSDLIYEIYRQNEYDDDVEEAMSYLKSVIP